MGGQVFTTAIIAADTNTESGFQGITFTGTFDGSVHKIANFTINGGKGYVGLFGDINSGGSVKNLGLENCSVSGSNYVGGLVGFNNGSISNCGSTGLVSGTNYVGGLVGYNNYGSINNCHSTGFFSMGYYVGGLVGYNNYGNISNCHSTGSPINSSSPTTYMSIGGLVGWNNYGNISNCCSTGLVNSLSSTVYEFGGLVGRNDGNISNCFSMGAVVMGGGTTWNDVGGLVGRNGGSISNCGSTGLVSVPSSHYYVGGLVGWNGGSIVSSFWDINTSGQTIGVGHGSSVGCSGKTMVQMRTLSIFTSAGWDFAEIWDIVENQTYPYLKDWADWGPEP